MKKRDTYLTGFLLIIIGVLIGTILTIYRQDNGPDDRAEVVFTEVRRSSNPVLSNEELEGIDSRFLLRSVAEKVTPSVVYIQTVVPFEGGALSPDDEEGDFWDRFVPRRAESVGSGVLITPDGYILTNNHVIEDAVEGGIEVVLNDKRSFDARVVGSDPTTDLAVLKIDSENLSSVVVGNSDEVNVGEWVLAIGNPFRLRSTVTAGIVSALGRDVRIIDERIRMRIESFIQTDAAINRGNSGGALVNTSGELIGINTAIASQNGSYQGYGFAVPINLAIKVARDLIQYGEVRRALLGVTIRGVDDSVAEEIGMNSIRGVLVTDVNPGQAADRSGLQPRDVILEVNGVEVNESNELQERIAVMSPGEMVTVDIWRSGEEFELEIELGMLESASEPVLSSNSTEVIPEEEERNGEFGSGVEFWSFSSLGFRVMALSTPQDPGQYDLIITEIEENSEAFRRGLKAGYYITEVNETEVADMESLRDLIARSLNESGTVMLQVETEEGSVGYYELKRQ